MSPPQAIEGCEWLEPAEADAEEAEAKSVAPNSVQVKTGRKIIRLPEVQERIPKSRTQIWRDVRAGKFPAPVSLGPNSIGWYSDEIDEYQAFLRRVG